MDLTSSSKSAINRFGILSGWVAMAILAPFVLLFLAGATAGYFPADGSLLAHYLYFMGRHPFILMGLCLLIIWMIVSYNTKEK
jgi:ABC-type transport system involved in multi-copper enzyme maturation permease subunit